MIYRAEVLGSPKLGLFEDPLAYPGLGLGENMIFPNYMLKLFFSQQNTNSKENLLKPKAEDLAKVEGKKEIILQKNYQKYNTLKKHRRVKIC